MDERIKVAHVLVMPNLTGVQRSMLDLLDHLDQSKFKIEVICRSRGKLTQVLAARGITVKLVPELRRHINPIKDLIAFIKLWQLYRNQKYQIIHTHYTKTGFLGRVAGKIAGVPVVIHTVHGFGFHEFSTSLFEKFLVILEKIAGRCSNLIISVNQYEHKLAVEKGIIPETKIITIPNGVDLQKFDFLIDRTKKRRELGIPENMHVVGTVCRLAKQKDPQTFIKAAYYILRERKDTVFLLIGGGEMEVELKREIQKQSWKDFVIFTGWRDDVKEILKILDIFVLSSLWEGLSIALLEAMAAGLPIIATDIKGNRELIKDNVNGLLMSPKNAKDLARKIQYLLDHYGIAQRLGEKARQMVEQNYNVHKNFQQVESIYLELYRNSLKNRVNQLYL